MSTELKSTYSILPLGKVRYCSYKNLNFFFLRYLSNSLSKFIDSYLNYDIFESVFEYVLDRRSGGLMLYAKNHLPLRRLECNLISTETQCLITKLNLRKKKWLILSIYPNPTQNLRLLIDDKGIGSLF